MQSDYLKYWRVVRQFIKAKHKLTQADLDILLFLKSEQYFSKDKFKEFDELISWNKNRFENLRQAGWIEVFRKRMGKRKALYQLSTKGKRVTTSIYKYLNGKEIPTSNDGNPMFLRNVSYTDKVYRNFITEMNAFTRQQRHQTQK
jgi:DNA-binding MarR family transcriptional regulator|tara:strand:+ start:1222 stop:1656 length:435 start_codon:yes stop_codon:yes gene_type:complete